eukprot:m.5892 g.5892  ORF g.5892 m.5892 type:complete len:133 (+) comp4652_c0_seq2:289-687(+)
MPYRTLDLAASFATNTSALTSIQFAAAALPALPFEEEEYYEDGSVFMSEDDMDVGMGMDMEEEEEEEEEFSNCEQCQSDECCHAHQQMLAEKLRQAKIDFELVRNFILGSTPSSQVLVERLNTLLASYPSPA